MAQNQTNPDRVYRSAFDKWLKRWFRGDLTRRDEAAMEQLAEKDAFLHESIDGYRSTPNLEHEEMLLRLRGKLRQKAPVAKRVPISRILAAAAAVVVLVAAIWLLPDFFTSADTSSNTIAQKQDTPPEAVEERQESDSEQVSPEKPAVKAPGRDIASGAGGGPATLPKDKPKASIPVEKEDMDAFQDVAEEPQRAMPPPVQTVEELPELPEVQAKKEQMGEIRQADDAVPLSNSGNVSRRAKPKAREEKMEEAAYNYEPPMENTLLGGQPEMGWADFNEYLRRKALLPVQARNNNVTGVVRLEFSIDSGGEPVNFNVLQGLGYGCDEEAKRLVQAVKWLPGAGGKTRVDVWFRR